ncbi:hypothetical protein [Microbulbifer sp. ZKSA002]|uniref:hypothetical protein n=1 Tax=Microbulbifer sp. ZKSA002 TaxID=3243388 RepID=UPI004039D561
MKKLLLDKDLSKDLLQSIGYYMLLAGIVRFCIPSVKAATFFPKLGFVIFFIGLSWFISVYIFIHVVHPIVKIYHPEFSLPEVDPENERKIGWREIVYTRSFILMMVLYLTTLYLGFVIVGWALPK